MSKVVRTEFIDDIDGSEAERTFTFAVDGVAFEIDLSNDNITEFNSAIGGFVESARKVGKLSAASSNGTRRTSVPTGARQSREQTQAVREWARNHGMSVNDRGRIPLAVQQAFDQEHQPHNLASVG